MDRRLAVLPCRSVAMLRDFTCLVWHFSALLGRLTAIWRRVAALLRPFPALLYGLTVLFRRFTSQLGGVTALLNHGAWLLSSKTSLLGRFALLFHLFALLQSATVCVRPFPVRNPNSEIHNLTGPFPFALSVLLLHPRMRLQLHLIEPHEWCRGVLEGWRNVVCSIEDEVRFGVFNF